MNESGMTHQIAKASAVQVYIPRAQQRKAYRTKVLRDTQVSYPNVHTNLSRASHVLRMEDTGGKRIGKG